MLETLILSNLIYSEDYCKKVIPFLKSSYFEQPSARWTFRIIEEYLKEYDKLPGQDALQIDLITQSGISEQEKRETRALIKSLTKPDTDLEWLLDQTEKFCQNRALYSALLESVAILEDKSDKKPRTIIPTLLQDALAISFDTNIGHDFLEDAEKRFDFYHAKHKRVPFNISILNKVTNGGLIEKTLNILMGGVGFGKTMFMCHFAGANLIMGKNVLYITLEMAEEEISKRIDANLLDISLKDLELLPRAIFLKKHEQLRAKSNIGKLIIKEYAEGTVGATHFRNLLHELKLKKNFEPDIIYIDYLNLCCSSRVSLSSNVGLYTYIKFIAEEIRGLAKEKGIPVFSATQLNRKGFRSSDPGMEDTSESFGLPATCDLLWVIVQSEDLIKEDQIKVKQLKNRYSNYLDDPTFVLGVDREMMRIFDPEDSAQTLIQKPIYQEKPKITPVFTLERFKGIK